MDRRCDSCFRDISTRAPKARFCSEACRRWRANGHTEARIRSVEACLSCGGSLDGKLITATYCSRVCKNAAVQKRRVRDDAARYLRERERRITYAKDYARANPHVGQAAKRRRRVRAAENGNFRFNGADWLRVQRRFGFRCAYCSKRGPLTMDHVVPIVRGGTHSEGNIVPACVSCNCHKQGRFVMEWKLGKSRRIAA